jgi:integrase/recombinase XerD
MPEAIATRLRSCISNQSLTGDRPLFPICYSTARPFIKKLGEEANVRIRPHDLRRHSATYASRNGLPLEVIGSHPEACSPEDDANVPGQGDRCRNDSVG